MVSDKKKIHFIDQTSEYDHHMVFNASMLKILHLIFRNADLFHYGLKSNIESVKSLLSEKEVVQAISIKHKKVSGGVIKKFFNYLRKEFYRFNNFRYILKHSNDNDWLVLSITTFTSFLWFKILKYFYKTNTIAVLHGDVDFIYKSNSFYERINALFHKIIFKIKAPNFYYLVLNKIEKDYLVQDKWLNKNEVIEIEHPYLNMREEEVNHELNDTLTLGHIGSMEVERKNSHYIFKLAEMCKDLISQEKLVFKSIGLMTPGVIPYKNKYVDVIIGNKEEGKPRYLTREDYETGLNSLDYILFFYPKDEYIFRASGAISDFLAKEKPIICLKHPIFEYMFEKGGDIGFMCENLYEMKQLIHKILFSNELQSVYRKQVENIKKYKVNFEIINVAKDLERQLNIN